MMDYTWPLNLPEGHIISLSTELAQPSPYMFGHKILNQFLPQLRSMTEDDPVDRCFLISDETVSGLYGNAIQNAVADGGLPVQSLILPQGEQAKTFEVLETLCETLVRQGATKRSLLLALGGGTIGNVVGLAAGLLFRGIRYVEIPTTFTHLTDGTLSNKQAINGCSGKNHFGVYHAPLLIWADTHYLTSEPRRFRDAGLVEGIKNGFIAQPAFLNYLRLVLNPNGRYGPEELTELAYKTVLSKLAILKEDPTEKHYAIVLEYGHTFAHAIEWLAQGGLLHGEAVALGMRIAARLAHRLGLISKRDVTLHDGLIDHYLGMEVALPEAATSEAILRTMAVDNKKTGDQIRYCLLERIGACANPEGDYLMAVDDATVLEVLRAFEQETDQTRRRPVAPSPRRTRYVA